MIAEFSSGAQATPESGGVNGEMTGVEMARRIRLVSVTMMFKRCRPTRCHTLGKLLVIIDASSC